MKWYSLRCVFCGLWTTQKQHLEIFDVGSYEKSSSRRKMPVIIVYAACQRVYPERERVLRRLHWFVFELRGCALTIRLLYFSHSAQITNLIWLWTTIFCPFVSPSFSTPWTYQCLVKRFSYLNTFTQQSRKTHSIVLKCIELPQYVSMQFEYSFF